MKLFLQALKKFRIPILTLLTVLFIDQFIKIYVKLHFAVGEKVVIAKWFDIQFTENAGMAFGYELGGESGKLMLSLLRIAACIAGIFYIRHIIRKGEHPGFVFSVSLILAGAIGNILDSAFYGLIFDRGKTWDPLIQQYTDYSGIAQLSAKGYAPSMYGCVVDMFHFPIFKGTFPSWFPFWASEEFEFFSPIFNLADASISVGVAMIIIFQKKFARRVPEGQQTAAAQNVAVPTADDPASHLNGSN